MAPSKSIPVLAPRLQVTFFHRLQAVRKSYLRDALSETVRKLRTQDIDAELAKYVDADALAKLASFSLRGEAVFPVPVVLQANPFLLGYYRLLFGLSQKEAYSKGPFGRFKRLEERGDLPERISAEIPALCKSLIQTGEALVAGIAPVSLEALHDLQLLTLGAQFRGSENVRIGEAAALEVFNLIKGMTKRYLKEETDRSLVLRNAAGRAVLIEVASDPDVAITETHDAGARPIVSIEIKGGGDVSNVHNRIGEAEKSHQKARKLGFFEFWTILRSNVDDARARQESPTTSHFFHLDRILDPSTQEAKKFRAQLTALLGIR